MDISTRIYPNETHLLILYRKIVIQRKPMQTLIIFVGTCSHNRNRIDYAINEKKKKWNTKTGYKS